MARRRRRVITLVTILIVLAGTAAAGLAYARRDTSITVRVDGRRTSLPDHATVRAALHREHVRPRDGELRAVTSHRAVDPRYDPARLLRNGDAAQPADRLRNGDRVTVINGRDATEPVTTRTVPIPAPGLPPIEYELWVPGSRGSAVQEIGARSGEIAASTTLAPPAPAHRLAGKVVALTFDDGPDPRSTPAILTTLREAGVKATFCVIGHAARVHPELLRAIAAQGHVACDHTETHPYLDRIAPADVPGQISGPAAFCQLTLGTRPAFFRAPYGATNQTVVDTAHAQGLRVLQWSVDPRDFDRPPPAEIVRRVMTSVRPGRIVLMHDGGGDRSNTVAALGPIIAMLKAQGYTFAQPMAD